VDVEVPASGTTKVPDVKLGKPVDHQAYVNSELQRAQEMMQTRQPAEARKIYEDILAKYGEKLPEDFRGQLHGAVAQTYAMQEQPAQAIEHLRQAVKLDPDNTDIHLVYGEMLVQTGQRAEGEKVLLAQDISKVKDPYPYMNIVIAMINEKRTQEAIDLLNRLIKQFPQEATLYYYRGRAHVAAEKFQEGRADLEKFVATAPADAREMEEAKSILGQLKDVK
jgi:Tfp pilus assembly protein PilF